MKMKIERVEKFQPITITLETKDELVAFNSVVNAVATLETHHFQGGERRLCTEIKTRLNGWTS